MFWVVLLVDNMGFSNLSELSLYIDLYLSSSMFISISLRYQNRKELRCLESPSIDRFVCLDLFAFVVCLLLLLFVCLG